MSDAIIRTCRLCGVEKEETADNFYRNPKSKRGFRTECKGCTNSKQKQAAPRDKEKSRAYQKAWRNLHPEKVKTARAAYLAKPGKQEVCANSMKTWRLALKRETMSAYGPDGVAQCNCCGEDHLCFLTLDHSRDDGAEQRRKIRGASVFYLYLRNLGFPNNLGLVTMCYNCNCGRRANGGVCPHELEKAKARPAVFGS